MESRLGWQRAIAAAEHFDTTVLLCELNQKAVQDHVNRFGPVPGLKFEFVPLHPTGVAGSISSYRSFYRDYHNWQIRAFKVAKRIHQKDPFSLTHQIGICGYREPGYLWKLDAPFLWGPFGGTQDYPVRFLTELHLKDAILEVSRSLMNMVHLRFRRRVREAVQQAKKIYAANSRNQLDFWKTHGRMPELQLETGVPIVPNVNLRKRAPGEPLRILWSGRFQPWKGLPLLLRALRGLGNEVPFELRLIGYQNCEAEYRSMVDRFGICPQVKWIGWPTYDESIQHYRWADVFVFTSLRDTSGTGLLEALSCGCPLIGLNHQGARDIMTRECALPIEVTTPGRVVSGVRNALRYLFQNPKELALMGRAALQRAEMYSWEKLGNKMIDDYHSVIEAEKATRK